MSRYSVCAGEGRLDLKSRLLYNYAAEMDRMLGLKYEWTADWHLDWYSDSMA